MKKLNLDKLVVGVLLGVCLMLAIGAMGMGMSHPVGTYQIATCADTATDQVYVLNTQTGQVWVFDRAGWDTLGHVSGIEEIVPRLKAIHQNSRISFKKQQ